MLLLGLLVVVFAIWSASTWWPDAALNLMAGLAGAVEGYARSRRT